MFSKLVLVQRYGLKPEKQERPLARDLENNIKMDREGAGCIDLVQNRDC